MSVTMYDDVNVNLLPPGAPAYAGYINGNWPNFGAVYRRFPKAKVVAISVFASGDGDCLDVENGDATTAQAPGWFKRRKGHTRTARPWIYTSASNVASLVAVMKAHGIARDEYYVWSAHYTDKAHICAPNTCGYDRADGTQFTHKALGHELDESLINAYMLPGYKPAAPKPAAEPNLQPIIDELNAAGHKAKTHAVWQRIHNAILALRGQRLP